ncbi:MAG TPA: SRPBCC domain-containing protein [Terriglobales bacterium]|nr:SRPBCC domain-containing protein [Terriglobales bacterium]
MSTFFYTLYIKTTPEQLWTALTNPEFTQQYWWGRRLESDWKIGSEINALYEGNKLDWKGKILISQPHTKPSYSFHLEEKPELKMDEPSIVTIEIEPAGKSILKLDLRHERLSHKGYEDVSDGWPALLSSMKSLLETGKPLVYD